MSIIINSADLHPGDLDTQEVYEAYNGLDCCVTFEVFEGLVSHIKADPFAMHMYNFSRALQGPALDMMSKGVLIDEQARHVAINELEAFRGRAVYILNAISNAVIDRDLNHASPAQLKTLFYEVMKLPPVMKRRSNGSYGPSTDRDALEQLQAYLYAVPFINCILYLRDLDKQLQVLRTGIDPDGRIRCSYNIGGTSTWRWSSNDNAFRRGTNLQNISETVRFIFVADPGKKFAYIDLEQAESRVTGWLAYLALGKHHYLDACSSGDLHTYVTKLAWPHAGWTGDPKHDKALAKEIFYRHYSRRDLAKKLGHGSNYFGKPPTMAKHAKIEVQMALDFQTAYFQAFPELPEWHHWTIRQLQLTRELFTPLGAHRLFFGRTSDESTWREGIAHGPQSTVGVALNEGLRRVWYLSRRLGFDLLLQVHDAILIQYDEAREKEIIPAAMKAMTVPIPGNLFVHDLRSNIIINAGKPKEQLVIPSEASVGWNFGKYADEKMVGDARKKKHKLRLNLDGLREWKGDDDRSRTRDPAAALLDRVLL